MAQPNHINQDGHQLVANEIGKLFGLNCIEKKYKSWLFTCLPPGRFVAGCNISELNIFILVRDISHRKRNHSTVLKFVLTRLQYKKRNRKVLAINDEFFFGM